MTPPDPNPTQGIDDVAKTMTTRILARLKIRRIDVTDGLDEEVRDTITGCLDQLAKSHAQAAAGTLLEVASGLCVRATAQWGGGLVFAVMAQDQTTGQTGPVQFNQGPPGPVEPE